MIRRVNRVLSNPIVSVYVLASLCYGAVTLPLDVVGWLS